jgi:hypothetical protein
MPFIQLTYPSASLKSNITPDAHGGDGGAFGQQGTQGYIDVSMEVCVNIPIIGQICIPIPISQLLGGLLPFTDHSLVCREMQ